ncbi:MAG: cytochrome c oxidase accessory protein CcoG [Gammaproteobacteria bacterium]
MNAPLTSGSDSYYVSEQKIYPREVSGRYARLRTLAVWVLLGLFYLMPWVHWNGRQAVLFDLPARKFYVFGLVMWPQDFIFLTALLVIAAFGLFFFTAIAGRLWCGFACPQTVWTETFLWMEQLVEGSRSERLKLDRPGWSARKLGRKVLKHALWIAFSLWTGVTFVGFFTPIASLPPQILALSLGPWELFWMLFYGFATYGNAGFLREQVCKYMCPYARFQSAMFDRDTLIVTYDEERGEPRGSRRRGTDLGVAGLGACVDCTLCVQVCPTGIDIRKGLQYECIACAACVDACDTVMDKMSYPRGLIRYTTQNALERKPSRVLRPRVLVYGALLAALILAFGVGIAMRTPLDVDIIRDRNALYRLLDDGRVENVYNVKILNKTEQAHRFRVTVRGDGELSLDPAVARFDVASGEVYSAAVRVRRPAYEPMGPQDIEFVVQAEREPRLVAHATARFIAPTQ